MSAARKLESREPLTASVTKPHLELVPPPAATGSAWWPIVFGGAFAVVVAFGVVVLHKTR